MRSPKYNSKLSTEELKKKFPENIDDGNFITESEKQLMVHLQEASERALMFGTNVQTELVVINLRNELERLDNAVEIEHERFVQLNKLLTTHECQNIEFVKNYLFVKHGYEY